MLNEGFHRRSTPKVYHGFARLNGINDITATMDLYVRQSIKTGLVIGFIFERVGAKQKLFIFELYGELFNSVDKFRQGLF